MKQYLLPQVRKEYLHDHLRKEGETMSHNMNNFTPLPGLWRTSARAYDTQISNNSEANEVPVFYRSHSTRATVSILRS